MSISHPKILVLGQTGQLGHALYKLTLDQPQVWFTKRQGGAGLGPREVSLDLLDKVQLQSVISDLKPQWIINAAAYTAVEKAEDEPELAFEVNAAVPTLLAKCARDIQAQLIHISTDYVFDGSLHRPYVETDKTHPLNTYGKSKLKGEEGIIRETDVYYILRTSWVFSSHGHNFLRTMLRLGQEKECLKVVDDQHGCPTSAEFLARGILHLIATASAPYGIYHLTCSGETTWHGFASFIFATAAQRGWALKVKQVEKVTTADYPSKVCRPLYSVLSSQEFCQKFRWAQVPWQDEVEKILASLRGKKHANL